MLSCGGGGDDGGGSTGGAPRTPIPRSRPAHTSFRARPTESYPANAVKSETVIRDFRTRKQTRSQETFTASGFWREITIETRFDGPAQNAYYVVGANAPINIECQGVMLKTE